MQELPRKFDSITRGNNESDMLYMKGYTPDFTNIREDSSEISGKFREFSQNFGSLDWKFQWV